MVCMQLCLHATYAKQNVIIRTDAVCYFHSYVEKRAIQNYITLYLEWFRIQHLTI